MTRFSGDAIRRAFRQLPPQRSSPRLQAAVARISSDLDELEASRSTIQELEKLVKDIRASAQKEAQDHQRARWEIRGLETGWAQSHESFEKRLAEMEAKNLAWQRWYRSMEEQQAKERAHEDIAIIAALAMEMM